MNPCASGRSSVAQSEYPLQKLLQFFWIQRGRGLARRPKVAGQGSEGFESFSGKPGFTSLQRRLNIGTIVSLSDGTALPRTVRSRDLQELGSFLEASRFVRLDLDSLLPKGERLGRSPEH